MALVLFPNPMGILKEDTCDVESPIVDQRMIDLDFDGNLVWQKKK